LSQWPFEGISLGLGSPEKLLTQFWSGYISIMIDSNNDDGDKNNAHKNQIGGSCIDRDVGRTADKC
jgi:hypothetical protein